MLHASQNVKQYTVANDWKGHQSSKYHCFLYSSGFNFHSGTFRSINIATKNLVVTSLFFIYLFMLRSVNAYFYFFTAMK